MLLGNIDGSIAANAWTDIPKELLAALRVDKKTEKAIAMSQNANEKIKLLAKHLIDEFYGSANREKLTAAIKKIGEVVSRPINKAEEHGEVIQSGLDKVGEFVLEKLRNKSTYESMLSPLLLIDDKVRNFIETKDLKLINTRSSWYSFINILNVLAGKTGKGKPSKILIRRLKEIVGGFTVDDCYNRGESFGINKDNPVEFAKKLRQFFRRPKALTKTALGKDLSKKLQEHNESLIVRAIEVADSLPGNSKKSLSDSAAELFGKSPIKLISDAARESQIYKTWLKRVGIAGAILVGMTWLAITQFGRRNKFNPDIYRRKEA